MLVIRKSLGTPRQQYIWKRTNDTKVCSNVMTQFIFCVYYSYFCQFIITLKSTKINKTSGVHFFAYDSRSLDVMVVIYGVWRYGVEGVLELCRKFTVLNLQVHRCGGCFINWFFRFFKNPLDGTVLEQTLHINHIYFYTRIARQDCQLKLSGKKHTV